jgi:hypothetical protein
MGWVDKWGVGLSYWNNTISYAKRLEKSSQVSSIA